MANNYKVYGNERTNLPLSDKAQRAYSQSTYTVIEKEDGSYAYYDGAVSRHNLISEGLTAEEMNELMEQEYKEALYNEIQEDPFCSWIEESGIDVCIANEPMDIKTAEEDLKEFEKSGWDMPEDMSAEDYMNAFNKMWNYHKG